MANTDIYCKGSRATAKKGHVLQHQIDGIQQLKKSAVNTSQTTRALNLNAIILFYECREKYAIKVRSRRWNIFGRKWRIFFLSWMNLKSLHLTKNKIYSDMIFLFIFRCRRCRWKLYLCYENDSIGQSGSMYCISENMLVYKRHIRKLI